MRLTCNVVRDLVAVYTDGAASDDTKRAVETHLSECPACARYYYDYKRIARRHRGSGRHIDNDTDRGFQLLSEKLRRQRTASGAVQLALLAAGVAAVWLTLSVIGKRK